MEPNNRVKISSIVESQLPSFVREDYPLVSEFLMEYYRSLEAKGSAYDLLTNIDDYVKVDNITNLTETTSLTSGIDYIDTTINVTSTSGFPHTYGLIKIDDEIILYKSKTSTSFVDCIRGFSGVSEYSVGNTEDLTFSETEINKHTENSEVINLSVLFLKEFFIKIKKQFAFGFENRELYKGLNENIFIKQSKDFYTSKGTDRSFEILFRVLYGKDVEVILPRDYLIRPSDAQYRVTRNLVVEPISGDIESLQNKTVFQDQYDNIPKSFGTVTDIQRIVREGTEYFILKLDYDFNKDIIVNGSIFGDLKIHPKTIITENLSQNATTISVDSTIGFPSSGELLVERDLYTIIISYNGKTVNQFLNCNGISEKISNGTNISSNTYAYGYSDLQQSSQVRFRITGVLAETNIRSGNRYYEKGDSGRIINLGYNGQDPKDNNWIINNTVKCEVANFTNDGNFKYNIITYDNNGVYDGDSVEVDYIDNFGQRSLDIFDAKTPFGSIPGKSFQITTNGKVITSIFSIKRVLSKYNNFLSDILNVYKDYSDETVYVTSSSLPFYGEGTEENFDNYTITLNGEFSGEILKIVPDGEAHGLLTGDAVVYSPGQSTTLGIQSGIYFAKKESETQIKLAKSRENIEKQAFVSIATTSLTNNKLILLRLGENAVIDSQKLVRSLVSPVNDGKSHPTPNGTIGILINGVEILNYKSSDYIYYGPIKSIDVVSSGKHFDVINPPVLEISFNSTSYGSTGYCGIEGSLERIDIVDPGFGYIDEPIINISGGSGSGAKATAITSFYDHIINLNPKSEINLATNQIGFSTYHKLVTGESIIYKTDGNSPIGGLTTDAKYYVNVIDGETITLHKNLTDSLNSDNPINLTSYGSGIHRIRSTEKKKKINSIIINNPGSGYKNKKVTVPAERINTYSNTVDAYSYPFLSGETIYYYGGQENISGLDTGSYIVTRVNDTSFKLSNIGTGTTEKDFYYKTKQYINFGSSGIGTHIFNYEPIQVSISGKSGAFNAEVQPVFRGEVSSIFVENGGVGYGSSEIINYNKQPTFNLNSGSNAKVSPIVSNGKIVDVVVSDPGSGYNSPPDLIINGVGSGAVLTPIISNGKITKVNIINGGNGYEQKNTYITVFVPGENCILRSNPQKWTINQVKRLIETNKITSDDSVAYQGKYKEYGIQYTHSYAPRSLRKKVFSEVPEDGITNYKQDYQNDFDEKKYHSPLLGWAYDGNPIYGPYGYDSLTNKTAKQVLSGYGNPTDSSPNRPDKKTFPAGYFVEDYVFDNSGDLDEHNGRFCITPEYPNGVYAYFMTLDENLSDSGSFVGDKKPKFPYIIGNTYKSKPIDFNFNLASTQDKFEFNDFTLRNVSHYNIFSDTSGYEYILNRDELLKQKINIKNTSTGSISSIRVLSGGENYAVGDRVVFDNSSTNGDNAAARVRFIKGRSVTGISQSTTSIYDVEFYPSGISNKVVGYSTQPHNLSNLDYVLANSLTEYNPSLENNFNINVNSKNYILQIGVGDTNTTGIVTYFYTTNPSALRENDVLSIESEEVKVLNVDNATSRIRILREHNSTIGTSHSVGSILTEKPRTFNLTLKTPLKKKPYNINRQIYFNPNESLGIGTNVGVGYTIGFSNPGVGITSITIPTKSIYIKNHNLNTGTELLYNSNSTTPITVYDGTSEFDLEDNSVVYAAKISNDLVGIATIKVGLGTTGEFVGISQTGSTLFFAGIGDGVYHSFTTRYDNVTKGSITKTSVTVSTASTHRLLLNDSVFMGVYPGITTSIKIQYSDTHRILTANPKDFTEIDYANNLINIPNHGYSNGEKLIHTSDSPATGLENQGVYYVVVYDENRIKLSNSYYDSVNDKQQIVNIESSSYGTLSQVNPRIKLEKNNEVVFDLSDSSLSQPSVGIGRTSSFDFKIFTDQNFSGEFYPSRLNITRIGNIGIDTTAKLSFRISDNFPEKVYYNLVPTTNLSTKNQIYSDTDVLGHNELLFVLNPLNGRNIITGITSNTFTIQPNKKINVSSYSQSDGSFSYYTNSTTELGEIQEFEVNSRGSFYDSLPSITRVNSGIGSNAIVIPQSTNIGNIVRTEIKDIGYNYSIDKTLIPTIKFPSVLRVETFSTIDYITLVSSGLNYNYPPDLVVIDGYTKLPLDDILLEFNQDMTSVEILKNTKGLYNVLPKIIPTNNSNGFGIRLIEYNDSTKVVKAYFSDQFSDLDDYPFQIGDNVFIEGIAITDSGKGYNSKNYNYSLFPIVGINTDTLGGSGSSVEYSLVDHLTPGEIPGTFDSENSSGRLVSENEFPTFEIAITKNKFIPGELVSNGKTTGTTTKWKEESNYLTVDIREDFELNDIIVGETSKSQAIVREIFAFDSYCKVDSSSIVRNGWNKNTGYLNDNSQRIHDNDYYQYFSYAIKSEISIEDWKTAVENLNHTLGFKKFSNLEVNSTTGSVILNKDQNQGLFNSVCDLNSTVDIECIHDYDLASENNFYIDGKLTSDEIIFNSSILIDYTESVGNRVLTIDDISDEFNTSYSQNFVTSFNI